MMPGLRLDMVEYLVNDVACFVQAAGRHQCSYLIKLQSHEFLLQGGDPDWLKGLERIPRKLKDLNEINKILAHRPWLITKDHIEVSLLICSPFKK